MDLGVISVKGYFPFPKDLELEPHHHMQFIGKVLTLWRDTKVFYNPSRQGLGHAEKPCCHMRYDQKVSRIKLSCVSSTKEDIDTRQAKACTAVDCVSVIRKPYQADKIKRSFFQAAVVSILLYWCRTWTLTKRMDKKLDSNYTRMLRAILNKLWRQHPTKSRCTATYHLSRKLSKLDKPDTQDTAGEVRTAS